MIGGAAREWHPLKASSTANNGLAIFTNNFSAADSGTGAAVNNLGTFIKSGPAANSTISATFNNSGTLAVQSGTLNIQAQFDNSGIIEVAPGATLNINGAAVLSASTVGDIDGTLAIAANTTTLKDGASLDRVDVNGGTLVIEEGSSVGALAVSSGKATLSGSHSVATLSRTGGDIELSGSLVVTDQYSSSGGTIHLMSASTIDLSKATGAVTGIFGSAGADTIISGDFNDNLTGSAGDTLKPGLGSNILQTSASTAYLEGSNTVTNQVGSDFFFDTSRGPVFADIHFLDQRSVGHLHLPSAPTGDVTDFVIEGNGYEIHLDGLAGPL